MTDKERYKSLKQENDDKLATFVDSYHFIANNYVLKARGYAEKNLDTEARIKDVLDELQDFCDRGLPAPMAIPNTTEYIKSKMVLLAKRKNTGEKVKSIIWTTLFITFIIATVGLGLYFRTDNPIDAPTNIKSEIVEDRIILSWDKDQKASFGYGVYYILENGKASEIIYVEQPVDESNRVKVIISDLDPSQNYVFYIFAQDVTKGEGEDFIVIYKGSEHTKYKYSPTENNND